MLVDKIYKNVNVYTSNVEALKANAFAVKDGKFVYVGDEVGLQDYEGDVVDLGGKFVTPALIDSHIHIPMCVCGEYDPEDVFVDGNGKAECLEIIRKTVQDNPNDEKYKFRMSKNSLNGERLTKDDLDEICSDKELLIVEGECHSAWINSYTMEKEGITDETPDIAPGLSYYEKDENGHKTGYLIEMTEAQILMANAVNITDEQIEKSVNRFIDFAKKEGIVAVFEAGTPKMGPFHEHVYKVMREMDKRGELPIYIDGCYSIADPREIDDAIEVVKRYREEFDTEHLKVSTLKIMNDGTLPVHTASLVEPYADTGTVGGRLLDKEQYAYLLKKLNKEGLDLHVHCVGEAASKAVLDGVELARKELGDDYHVQVTCAHLEIQCDEDLPRFAELSVIANYTPWWHAGGGAGGSGTVKDMTELIGSERAHKMYRSKTVWDSGALVTWSNDSVFFGEFDGWSPYLGIEGGIRRIFDEHSNLSEVEKLYEMVPTEAEAMSIDEMLLGYTINGAKQLKIEDKKGSIEVGKDADFLIFDEDLTTRDAVGLSYVRPQEVWFAGELIHK